MAFGFSSGSNNTADGASALQKLTSGSSNTAIGNQALNNNTTGGSNIALGDSAGSALTTGNNNIDIGNQGVAGESSAIRIGTAGNQTNTFIAGIFPVTIARGQAVFIDSTGHLGTRPSSARFKDAIKPMDKVSEAILALKPVTFHYKKELDPERVPQFGLVAEDVEKVNPDLVVRDPDGKAYTVRYDAVNAMLLNEFIKEHRKVEGQQAMIAELRSTIAQQQKGMAALAAGLQKVNDQLELNKPAPHLAGTNQ